MKQPGNRLFQIIQNLLIIRIIPMCERRTVLNPILLTPWFYCLLFTLSICIIILIRAISFRNTVIQKIEAIKLAKSKVRISKAKYLQVLRKIGTTQNESNISQGSAYFSANAAGKTGEFIGGAIGQIDSNFEATSDLVVTLADEYQTVQDALNRLVNQYNVYISSFPRVIFTKMFHYTKEEYIDNEKLSESTKLQGFEENDI